MEVLKCWYDYTNSSGKQLREDSTLPRKDKEIFLREVTVELSVKENGSSSRSRGGRRIFWKRKQKCAGETASPFGELRQGHLFCSFKKTRSLKKHLVWKCADYWSQVNENLLFAKQFLRQVQPGTDSLEDGAIKGQRKTCDGLVLT